MYAVIRSGGKQYRVCPGQRLKVEKLSADQGQIVHFDEVLLVSNGQESQVGTPFVSHATVSAEVIEHGRKKKVNIIKFKRRKHHLKRQGHRQHYTAIQVTGIEAQGITKKDEDGDTSHGT